MKVTVVPFARIREIVGTPSLVRDAPDGATAGQLWASLAREYPLLAGLLGSTRLVRNGAFVDGDATLHEGDELALLPPFGGG